MIKLPLYGTKKLLLALEYGIVLSETAKGMEVELTSQMVKKMQDILTQEFRNKSAERVALDMLPNILAVFEPN